MNTENMTECDRCGGLYNIERLYPRFDGEFVIMVCVKCAEQVTFSNNLSRLDAWVAEAPDKLFSDKHWDEFIILMKKVKANL